MSKNKSVKDREVQTYSQYVVKRPQQDNKVEHSTTARSVTENVPKLISRHRRVACLTHGQDGSVVLQELGKHTKQQPMKIIVEEDDDHEDNKTDIVQVFEDNEIHVLPSKECPPNIKQERKQPRLPPNHQMRASGGFVLLVILAGVVLLFFLLSPDIEEIFSKYSTIKEHL